MISFDEPIAIFATGGTFDKEYHELEGVLYFKEPHAPDMLRLGRSSVPARFETVMMKDSLDLTDADRAAIADACARAPERRIVITHGTDTLEVTARHLAERVHGKTIVLTGAMVPYTFGSSDGLFNLGSALAFAQALPPGVYVAMNGRCFAAGEVTKDRRTGRFERCAPRSAHRPS